MLFIYVFLISNMHNIMVYNNLRPVIKKMIRIHVIFFKRGAAVTQFNY